MDGNLLKKVASVKVFENKNEVKTFGFMVGDREVATAEVEFKHLFGEENLENCNLRWVVVDDVGSLIVGETKITKENKAVIKLPNKLFTCARRLKVQLTVASKDGSRILNLQQFTDLNIINNLSTNEIVEPVYGVLINDLYGETYKCIESIKEYLLTTPNGGNAEYLRGYAPSDFEKVETEVVYLKNVSRYKVGDVVEVLGYYTKGDGAHHKRKVEAVDDGSGILMANGLYANVLHGGEINVSWFGAKVSSTEDQSPVLQKAINYSINKSCGLDFTMKDNGSFLLENCLKFSKTTGDTIGHIKFSRFNGFTVDDSKMAGKYSLQFGDYDATSWMHGRWSGCISGHCFVSSKSRNNKCHGIFIKGGWISMEFMRANNFNGTGIYLDSVHDSIFQKLSVERCGNDVNFAFDASSRGDTYNCTHIVSVQMEQSYNKTMRLNLLRALVSNIHAERTIIDDSYTGVTHAFDLTNSTIVQALINGYKPIKVSFTLMASTMMNIFAEGGSTWTGNHASNSSIINSIIGDVTCQHPIGSNLIFQGCYMGVFKNEKARAVDCTIKEVCLITNSVNTLYDRCAIEKVTFSGSRTQLGNKFTNCKITDISRISDVLLEFINCDIENLNEGWNSRGVFTNCRIQNSKAGNQSVYDFVGCFIENWSSEGNKAYTTLNTRVTNHITPWSLPSNYNHQKGTKTERTDGLKGGQIHLNDGLGHRPNPGVTGEIISPWHVIASW